MQRSGFEPFHQQISKFDLSRNKFNLATVNGNTSRSEQILLPVDNKNKKCIGCGRALGAFFIMYKTTEKIEMTFERPRPPEASRAGLGVSRGAKWSRIVVVILQHKISFYCAKL